MKPKILIFTSTEGHLSLAQAIADSLPSKEYEVKLIDLWSQHQMLSLYLIFYRYFPGFFRIPYQISYQQTLLKATKMMAIQFLGEKIKNTIAKCRRYSYRHSLRRTIA